MYDLLEALKTDLRDRPGLRDPAPDEIESVLPRLARSLPALTEGAVPYESVLHATETLILLKRLDLPDHARIIEVLERGRKRTLGKALAALFRVATEILATSGPRVAAMLDTLLEDLRAAAGDARDSVRADRVIRAGWRIGYFHEYDEHADAVPPALGLDNESSLKALLLDFLERTETMRRTGLLKARTQETNDLFRLQVYCGNAIDRIEFLQLQLGAGAGHVEWEFPDPQDGWRDHVLRVPAGEAP